jgi:hypothetical protein
MAERNFRKSMFRTMFRAESGPLNIADILCRKFVQGENGVASRSYAGPEHRPKRFSPNVQASTLNPEQHWGPLGRAQFVQEGDQGNSHIFGDPGEGLFRAPPLRVNELPRRMALDVVRTAQPGSPGEACVENLLPISKSHGSPQTRSSVALADLQSGKGNPSATAAPGIGLGWSPIRSLSGAPHSTPHRARHGFRRCGQSLADRSLPCPS